MNPILVRHYLSHPVTGDYQFVFILPQLTTWIFFYFTILHVRIALIIINDFIVTISIYIVIKIHLNRHLGSFESIWVNKCTPPPKSLDLMC